MNNIICAKQKVRSIISKSSTREDPIHAENVLGWILKLKPGADEALQIAALAHDIDRADDKTKIKRSDFDEYDEFKAAHAKNSAKILRGILEACEVPQSIVSESCRLVERHEFGGDERSDLLKDADSISFFEVNIELYLEDEGEEDTLMRCMWGYRRLSPQMKKICQSMTYPRPLLNQILQKAIRRAEQMKIENHE